ncbi:hypothetical protein K2P97_06995 [bacterium]|nr:hypothetical protein [bacterium]
MTDLMKDQAWQKANNLIQEKYGKTLSYRSLKLITEASKNQKSEQFYTAGDDLIIPLKLKNFDLGDVVVGRGSFLDQQQKAEIVDLIKFLVEPKLYSLQLKKSEENLLNISTTKLSLVDSSRVVELYQSEKAKKQTLSQIILLKSHTEMTRNKVALKIHEMTERNLFVHLDDIIASLSSKEDLKTLNDVTIYIQDVQLLSKDTLNLLQEFLELNTTDGPLFLVGSSLSMEAIESQDWSPILKKDLMGFYFDIDRVPLSQQTSEEILELLFFQLDEVLS